MKNISLYLNIVLIIAVTLLYIDRFSGKSSNDAASKTVASGSGGEIVYINVDTLVNGFDLYNELKTKVLQEQQQSEASINSKYKAYQRKALEFQDKVQKGLVTQAQAKQMQEQLVNEEQSLVQLKDQLQMQLVDKQQDMNKQIYERLTNYLKKYNKDKKYKMIIGNTMSNVLEADASLDITNEILKGLNEEYLKDGKSDTEEKSEESKDK